MRPPSGSARTVPVPPPQHVIKILISTDNHLGYLEKDPVRGDDSFRVFEEVLEIAKANQVDMVLLGGDLFHDNKPSRNTLINTMRILRQHCLSPEGEIHLAVRSDPAIVNYMDPCVAVSLPVFVIHGNHDDPTGGAGKDALSALDLLAQAGLITYFGRVTSSKKIQVSPILLQKGSTGLALYGLGNVRDEILYNTWVKERRVKWLSPEQPSASADAADDDNSDGSEHNGGRPGANGLSWFNLFVLHQNRWTRGSSRGISETLLPEWLDYVVWGHEHDSLPDLTLSKPPIVQPGSTVATSLSVGESKPKHAILLEVYEGKLKHRPVPLHTVRNFEFQDIVLSKENDLSETDPDGLVKRLQEIVNEMVQKQETEYDNKVSSFQSGLSKQVITGVKYPPRAYYVKKLTPLVRQPLIRLKVEVSGNWEPPNPQRFGQGYVGRCACPADMLLYYRSRRTVKRSKPFLQGQAGEGGVLEENEEEEGMNFSQTEAEEQDVVHIPKLVQYFLYHRQAGGSGLKFLELDRLSSAVDQFVNKLENRAIPDYVTAYLKVQQDKTLKEATTSGKGVNPDELLEKFKNEAIAAANRVLVAPPPSQTQNDKTEDKSKSKAGGEKSVGEVNGKGRGSKKIDAERREVGEEEIEAQLDEVHAVLANHPKIVAATAAVRAAQVSLDKAKGYSSEEGDEVKAEEKDDTGGKRKGRKGSTRGRGRGGGGGRGRGRGSSTATRMQQTTLERSVRRSTRRNESIVIEESEEEGGGNQRAEDSDEDYVAMGSSTRKRRARTGGSEGRSAQRQRVERVQSGGSSQRRQSSFASRVRMRRNTATIDVDEESGDDAL